jgi:hypothetical protein
VAAAAARRPLHQPDDAALAYREGRMTATVAIPFARFDQVSAVAAIAIGGSGERLPWLELDLVSRLGGALLSELRLRSS